MILADKIISLRKKNGWSQEELAEKLNVTRQSVSKWEGSLSTPDLDKILQLARIFNVTTDYLLKDEMEEENVVNNCDSSPLCGVSLKEEREYKERKHIRIFEDMYWPIVLIIYLSWSFITNKWGVTWIVWPIAAVLFSLLIAIFGEKVKEKE